MDDIAAGVITFEDMNPALRKCFDCLREMSLKLSAHKCDFGTTKNDYLGSTFTSEGISPENEENEKILGQIRMPNATKQVKGLIGSVQFFRIFVPNLGQNLVAFYKLFDILKADLTRATHLTLRLAKPGLSISSLLMLVFLARS